MKQMMKCLAIYWIVPHRSGSPSSKSRQAKAYRTLPFELSYATKGLAQLRPSKQDSRNPRPFPGTPLWVIYYVKTG